MFGTMVNDGSFRAISGEMVGVAILANRTIMFLMLLSTFLDLAHLSKHKQVILFFTRGTP